MFNATNLLGTLMRHIATPSAPDRLGTAFSQQVGSGGPLGGLLSRLGADGAGTGVLGNVLGALGGGGRDTQADRDHLMNLARQAVASPRQELASNNPFAVGGLGALVGTMMGGGSGAVGGGLLAVLGSLAYSALQARTASGPELASYPSPAAPVPAPASTGSGGYGRPAVDGLPVTEADIEHTARLVLRSMIQAAKADGQVDASEIERIAGKIGEGDPQDASDARAFVFQEMGGAADIESLVRDVRSPMEAAEVYAAALMAIEVDSAAERHYLGRLAQALNLPSATIAHLHQAVGLPAAT